MIPLKNERECELMRKAGKLTGEVLRFIEPYVQPGATTAQLDKLIERFIVEHGGVPSFKNLYGFPGSACISINEVVVHGLPSDRALIEGDIVSIDVGACVDKFHGDAARTFAVGQISEENRKLIRAAEESFFKAMEHARAGRRLGGICHAVQTYVEAQGFGVVRAMCGHGIGRKVHEEPNIPNYGPESFGPILKAGYCLAIEPMITLGTYKVAIDPVDGWTCRTLDGKNAAHYENTVLITEGEPEILTV